MGRQADFKSLEKSLHKQRIIHAGIGVFHEKGYGVATLDHAAGVPGLTRPALCRYASFKEEPRSMMYVQAIKSFSTNTYDIGEQDLTPPQELSLLIRDHISRIITSSRTMFTISFGNEAPPAFLMREEPAACAHFASQSGLHPSGRAVAQKAKDDQCRVKQPWPFSGTMFLLSMKSLL